MTPVEDLKAEKEFWKSRDKFLNRHLEPTKEDLKFIFKQEKYYKELNLKIDKQLKKNYANF